MTYEQKLKELTDEVFDLLSSNTGDYAPTEVEVKNTHDGIKSVLERALKFPLGTSSPDGESQMIDLFGQQFIQIQITGLDVWVNDEVRCRLRAKACQAITIEVNGHKTELP